MPFGDYRYLPQSYYPQRLLMPQQPLPHYDPYSQPSFDPMWLPVPPPPNAVQYPRITLNAADWSPTKQCFTGECIVVAKTEGLNVPSYECKATFTLSYIPVNEWYPSFESSRQGPVLIDSRDLQVIWDATRDRPVVEATTTSENHWKKSGVEAYGPCEILVTPFEGSNLGSYACSAYYTLQCQCEPLEDWKEVHEVAKNCSDFHEKETFAAAYEDSHITGSQNDVNWIPAYETPKTKTEFFEYFPLSTEVVTQPEESDEQKESAPVENASGKYYSDKKIFKKFEDGVQITNTVIKKQGRFCVSIAELCPSTLLQDKAAKQSSRDDINPITELSLSNIIPLKTYSYPEEPDTTDSTFSKDLEKRDIPVSIASKPQEGNEEDMDQLMAVDKLRAENKQQVTETYSSEKDKEFEVSDELSEWDTDHYEEEEEDEDYEDDDEQQDNESEATEKEMDGEFQGIGSEVSSEEDECSEWELDEEDDDEEYDDDDDDDDDDDEEWETVEQ